MSWVTERQQQSVCKLETARFNIYQLLHQYHKILAACNIQREPACEFSSNIAQSQYFVVLMQYLFYNMADPFIALHSYFVARQSTYVA